MVIFIISRSLYFGPTFLDNSSWHFYSIAKRVNVQNVNVKNMLFDVNKKAFQSSSSQSRRKNEFFLREKKLIQK